MHLIIVTMYLFLHVHSKMYSIDNKAVQCIQASKMNSNEKKNINKKKNIGDYRLLHSTHSSLALNCSSELLCNSQTNVYSMEGSCMHYIYTSTCCLTEIDLGTCLGLFYPLFLAISLLLLGIEIFFQLTYSRG